MIKNRLSSFGRYCKQSSESKEKKNGESKEAESIHDGRNKLPFNFVHVSWFFFLQASIQCLKVVWNKDCFCEYFSTPVILDLVYTSPDCRLLPNVAHMFSKQLWHVGEFYFIRARYNNLSWSRKEKVFENTVVNLDIEKLLNPSQGSQILTISWKNMKTVWYCGNFGRKNFV